MNDIMSEVVEEILPPDMEETAGIITKDEWFEVMDKAFPNEFWQNPTLDCKFINLDVCKAIADITGIEHFMSGPVAVYKGRTLEAKTIAFNAKNVTASDLVTYIYEQLEDNLVFPYMANNDRFVGKPAIKFRFATLPRSIFN